LLRGLSGLMRGHEITPHRRLWAHGLHVRHHHACPRQSPSYAVPPRHPRCCCPPQAWFESNESADPLPWVEVRLPHNVTMVSGGITVLR
jgi:hypothetical protein